jgi:hypothetical protein
MSLPAMLALARTFTETGVSFETAITNMSRFRQIVGCESRDTPTLLDLVEEP